VLVGVLLLAATPAEAQDTAPNGRIAFSSTADGDADIYTMNPDGSGLVNLTDAFGPWSDDDPNWSPDGSKIVFASGRGGGDGHLSANNIFVMNADGSNQVQLTFEPDHLLSVQPSWSPDGSKLAFASDRGGDWEIFTMNPDGSGQTNVTGPNQNLDYDDRNPDWSPDGSRIVFVGVRQGAVEILTSDPDGTDEANLTGDDDPPETNWNEYPSYRPDGSKILFMSMINNGGDDWDIWVMDPDGANKQNIVPDDAHQDVAPTWSPDGNRIAFSSSRSEEGGVGGFDVFSINYPPAAAVQQLTTNGESTNPDWGTSRASLPTCGGRAPTAVGTAGPDTFVGGPGVDVYLGFGGADTIGTGGRGDYVCAGRGRDLVRGEAGPDQLFAGTDNDRLNGGDGNDRLAGDAGTDVCAGGAGADVATGCESKSGIP
jgi:Tol biopolymer transport system component